MLQAVEILSILKRQGYVSIRLGAVVRHKIPEQLFLDAAAHLGLTVQTIGGSLWVRL